MLPLATRSEPTPSIESVSLDTVSIIAADWDAPSTWKVAYPDGSMKFFTRQQMLNNVPFEYGGTEMVVESTHLKERNEFSVAQVFTRSELDAWRPPVTIKLFPARLAPKVGVFAGNDKTQDAASLLLYVAAHPKMYDCLKVFRPPGSDTRRDSWAWRDEVRDDIRMMLNILRAQWKGMNDIEMETIPAVAHCRALVSSAYDSVPPSAWAQMNVKIGKVGARKGQVMFVSPTQIMTLYACAYNADGELRLNQNDNFIGVRALLDDVVGLCHSHMPNLARANFMHFGLRPKLKKLPPDEHQAAKAQFTKNLKIVLRALRDQNQCELGHARHPSTSGSCSTPCAEAATRSEGAPSNESVNWHTVSSDQPAGNSVSTYTVHRVGQISHRGPLAVNFNEWMTT